jgi:hypothetical protein
MPDKEVKRTEDKIDKINEIALSIPQSTVRNICCSRNKYMLDSLDGMLV